MMSENKSEGQQHFFHKEPLLVTQKEYPVNIVEVFGKEYSPRLNVWGILPGNFCIAVVGSREVDDSGLETTRLFADYLARHGVGIVSGMARGIDYEAHRAAINAGGRTVGVYAGGMNVMPKRLQNGLAREISRHGAVISPFSDNTPVTKGNFLERNKITAAMSLAILVPFGLWHVNENGEKIVGSKSGTYSTVLRAGELGIDIIAVPGSELTNYLLGHGKAVGADNPQEVLDDLVRIRAQRRKT